MLSILYNYDSVFEVNNAVRLYIYTHSHSNYAHAHRQQNKCYPQRCLLAHFEATLDFSRSEFTCP